MSCYLWQVSYKRQELLTIHQHQGSLPVIGGVRVADICLWCVVLFWFSVCFACLCLVSCVPNVASVYGLFFFVLCTQCCLYLWIACLRPVSCVPNVASVYGLLVFVLCLVYPMLSVSMDCFSSSCVLCTQCCQCLWIACLRPVSCVPNVVSVYELFFFVLCTQCCLYLWIACLRSVSCVPNVASASRLSIL